MSPFRFLAPRAAAVFAASVLAVAAHAAAAVPYTFMDIRVPGAYSTMPAGIAENGTIVGSYQFETGPDLLMRPFSLRGGEMVTYPAGDQAYVTFDDFNDRRHLVSNVGYRDFSSKAFFGDREHQTEIAVPGAIATQAYGLSDRDLVVGAYQHDPNELGITTTSAFAWSAKAGYRSFDAPGAAGLTVAWGVNGAGTGVGVYMDADSVYHGFIRTRDGGFTTVDYPGSPYTQLMGINARGDVVGFYQDTETFNLHGFVWRDGKFESVEPPTAVNGSYPYRITDDGRVLGYYVDANWRGVGFLATPAQD